MRAQLARTANRYRLDASEIEGEFNDRTYGADMCALRSVERGDSLERVVRRVLENSASRLARRKRRARAGLPRVALDRRVVHATPPPGPAEAAEMRDLVDACEQALLHLPAPHATALRAQACGLTKREIGHALVRPDGTPVSMNRVTQLLRLARLMVRDALAGLDVRRRYRRAFRPVLGERPD